MEHSLRSRAAGRGALILPLLAFAGTVGALRSAKCPAFVELSFKGVAEFDAALRRSAKLISRAW